MIQKAADLVILNFHTKSMKNCGKALGKTYSPLWYVYRGNSKCHLGFIGFCLQSTLKIKSNAKCSLCSCIQVTLLYAIKWNLSNPRL